MKKTTPILAAAAAVVALGATGSSAETLDDVRAADQLVCGVNTGLPGFSQPDAQNNWAGIDVDVCRAIAAAVLGDSSKVEFVPLTAKERFTALQSGEIDVLSRNTTWTITRDSSLGLNFAGVNFYDGQGFMVSKDLGVSNAIELDGATVCVQSGTTTELNLADFFRENGISFEPVVFDTGDQTIRGFEAGRCDVLTSDRSQLSALRIKLADPSSAIVLPDTISKEPLGPVVRQGDDQWFNIVKWTLFLMLNAEESGISSQNVNDMMQSSNPNTRRILGVEGNAGVNLGLDNEWGVRILTQVGNYAEIYDRNVGVDSPLNIARGINALWNAGGIQFAPPIR